MKAFHLYIVMLLLFCISPGYAAETVTPAIPSIWWLVPISSLIGLFVAFLFYRRLLKEEQGTDTMKEIAQHVYEGAMAYLRRQYKTVSIVFVVVFAILGILAFMGIQNPFVPVAFLTGGFFSGLCGFLGMKTATLASSRTANAARTSLDKGLKTAFRSGAVMGLVVVGFGLFDISLWYFLLNYMYDHNVWGLGLSLVSKTSLGDVPWSSSLISNSDWHHAKMIQITATMITFGMGASMQALFARVGGGIYTKAADVGADLVGKVEAGIPEDDPRNPATIADNVGDNVGDVAGMGADLYESYCGSILATAALGAALPASSKIAGTGAIIAPMLVAALGILLSLLGIVAVRTKENASPKDLLNSLLFGTAGASVLILLALLFMVMGGMITWGIFGAVVSGLVAGVLIGQSTEYFTSDAYKPTQGISDQAKMGSATTIIDGIAVGMFSTGFPVVIIIVGILAAFGFAGGFTSMADGLYGIGFAAVGMLSTLGIIMATDAFGPIADNAGGNAEMSGLGDEVRQRTDELDMLGNTTAATGKGFAIGSAALTAMALLAAYLEEIKLWISHLAGDGIFKVGNVAFANKFSGLQNYLSETSNVSFIEESGKAVTMKGDLVGIVLTKAHLADFLKSFDLSIMNPFLLCGIFIGAMMCFVFCAMTIKAVGRAAGDMVNEVRRQFKEIPGIMQGKAKPDYARCVAISTAGAQREMIAPSLLAIIVPVLVGIFLGVPGVMGLLAGGLCCGFSLACMLNNSGGAWDNAKKYIEKGHHGGKGSNAHKAGVVGDTVGDPFKDTAGPSLNILIKLMTMVSVVFSGLVVKYSTIFQSLF